MRARLFRRCRAGGKSLLEFAHRFLDLAANLIVEAENREQTDGETRYRGKVRLSLSSLRIQVDRCLIAEATADAMADPKAKDSKGLVTVSKGPIEEWERWQTLQPNQRPTPTSFITIDQVLRTAGFNP